MFSMHGSSDADIIVFDIVERYAIADTDCARMIFQFKAAIDIDRLIVVTWHVTFSTRATKSPAGI